LIPFVSAILAFLSMQISMKTNGTAKNSDNPMANNKTMMYTMPLISLWIGFTLPAALGVYWIANNVFTMAQELLAGKLLKKDFEAAAVNAKNGKDRKGKRKRRKSALPPRQRRSRPPKGKRSWPSGRSAATCWQAAGSASAPTRAGAPTIRTAMAA
jgi:YidC/Oxa1 family membrane protein insertase